MATAALLLPALLLVSAACTAGVVQCWTDERGARACGDTVSPQEARRQRELIDKRGVTQRVIPAQKTAEQVAEEQRVIDERVKQQAYDRYLIQTYRNVDELRDVRDERLATLNGRMKLAQKALVDSTATLENLHQREKTAPDPGEAPDPALARQIREFSKAREENLSAIGRIEEERKSVTAQFANDIQRYQLLRGASGPRAAQP
ncbi:MAG: hypothetical protein NVS9B10_24180 [Nevskia sp.]